MPRKKKAVQKNHVALVIDRSGSMWQLARKVEQLVASTIDQLRKSAAETGQETTISLFTFSNSVSTEYFRRDVTSSQLPFRLVATGSTALFDGVGHAIDALRSVGADANDPNTSFLVIAMTDGEENSSRRYGSAGNPKPIADLIRAVERTDRWTVTFQAPPGGVAELKRLGISSDNVRAWEATEAGTEVAAQAITRGVSSYMTARSLGQSRVDTFYVETDASNIKKKDLNKLDDLSDRFKAYDVPTEQVIADFVQLKTKKPYVVGAGFYLLQKPEKVQPQKQVLIVEKGKKAVYGGAQARQLIGLPDGVHAKVTPGNHAKYDIFVQSTSVNRKLPRGTKILVDTKMSQGLTPTWDHTAPPKNPAKPATRRRVAA